MQIKGESNGRDVSHAEGALLDMEYTNMSAHMPLSKHGERNRVSLHIPSYSLIVKGIRVRVYRQQRLYMFGIASIKTYYIVGRLYYILW